MIDEPRQMTESGALVEFRFPGRGDCCGKPRGCSATHAGCKLLKHPWKRAVLFGDETVQCQATCVRPHPDTGEPVAMQCVLKNRHEGACDPQPCGVA